MVKSKKDKDNGTRRWVEMLTRRFKLLAVMVGLVAGTSVAYATVTNINLLSQFEAFREIALVAMRGTSMPALQAKFEVYNELRREEQNKERPDAGRRGCGLHATDVRGSRRGHHRHGARRVLAEGHRFLVPEFHNT
jgi:hypothetical protein